MKKSEIKKKVYEMYKDEPNISQLKQYLRENKELSKNEKMNILNNEKWRRRIKCLCFDLDGTLVDTLEDICDALNKALEKNNCPTLTYDEYKPLLGHGAKHLVTKALKDKYTDELFEKVYHDYVERYSKFPCVKSKPYKGITNMLLYAYKCSYYLVVVTNKPEEIAKDIVNKVFPDFKFDLVIGESENYERKPSSQTMKLIQRTFILKETEIAYFGDSEVDYLYAKNSNIQHYYSFYHGFRTKDELVKSGVRSFVDKPSDIIKLLHYQGGYKENGRLSLAIISYLIYFSIFITDIVIVVQNSSYFMLTPILLGFAVGIGLMLLFFIPYAIKKSYLDYRLYLASMFYLIGAGCVLSAFVAATNIDFGLNYILSREIHILMTVVIGSIVATLFVLELALFIRDKYRIVRREKEK